MSDRFVVPPSVHALPVEGAPELFAVRRIYCVGRNYIDHIREMKEADERDPPFFFQKPTDALVQNGATVAYPMDTQDFQFEIELVVALGGGGRRIPVQAAKATIFGYAVGLDMTRRDRQREARDRALAWEMGKSFDQSAPCSALVPVSSIGHPHSGAITLSVNGQERQRGDLSQLIWGVPEIISKLSQQYELKPGDLIYTGTPAGVGAVVPGDRLVGEIDGVGQLAITIGPEEK
ncbi:FAA hydrolase family protein [Pseudolabrys taiwanensis]|uniref:FAA hydrolase family protein n=1 Tax=Pseudolabrys taiwanensis TaxID=331696 RepID=A0A345ZR82_9HYPH|nr:fumarylacetoacetate hydrolase family protein [Pseudolabrys taiwanensis]AXK79429.1 FAA hydrolase family protein [Pseudolabrys taiwanensis]